MKPWLILSLALALTATLLPHDADAKRLGGGKSSGLQRNMPARTAPDAPPAKPAQPAQNAQPAPQQGAAPAAAPTAAAAATPPKRNWLGPIAGLAAGLGLAALLSHFGLGEAFANGLMMALLAGVALFALTWAWRRFGPGARQPALATVRNAPAAEPAWAARPEPVLQRTSTPEPAPFSAPAASAAAAAPAAEPVSRAFVPAAFDSEGFGRTAKALFIRLQAAHDAADLDDLRRCTTPEMFASLRLDIQERGPAAQHTDVQEVNAEVVDIAQDAERQIVSVRYRGRLLEAPGAEPVAFDEVWHLTKAHEGDKPWAIAGIEQMN